jgi:hypothetical protein
VRLFWPPQYFQGAQYGPVSLSPRLSGEAL